MAARAAPRSSSRARIRTPSANRASSGEICGPCGSLGSSWRALAGSSISRGVGARPGASRATINRSIGPMISRLRRCARATIASMRVLVGVLVFFALALAAGSAVAQPSMQEYAVPSGSHPHDVAPAVDGGVWFTAQSAGYLGWLDPGTGEVRQIALGPRSAPHGVIVGPDGAPWVTDGGQNAIVRVDPQTSEVRLFPLPGRNANLNTATFDRNGTCGSPARTACTDGST